MDTKLTETGQQVKNFVKSVEIPQSKWEKVAEILSVDLGKSCGSRESLDAKIAKWDKQYEAIPEQEVRTFPWKNASNIVAPLIGIDTDAVVARIVASLLGQPEVVSIKTLRPDLMSKDVVEPLGRYLNYAARQQDDLDTERCIDDLVPDTVLNGLAFMKIPYVYETEEVPDFAEDLSGVTYRTIEKHNGPQHVWVSMSDMLWPEGTIDIQKCRWLAQRFYLEWWQVLQRVDNPSFGYQKAAVDRLKKFLSRVNADEISKLDAIIGFTGEPEERLEMYEVYIRGDFEKIGEFREYIVTVHPESSTIVKFVRNFYAHQKRPYVPFVFKKRRKSVVGAGMGHLLERLQDGITASLNQMVDNSTAANTIVLKVKKGALKPGEEIYPMKKLYIDGELSDVEQFRLGENASGMAGAISIMREFAERRSSVTDYLLGMESPDVGTRATAAGTLSLIQEGNRQIDQHIRLFRLSMCEVWRQTVQVYQQFAPVRKIVGMLGPDAAPVMEIFQFPSEYIFDRVQVVVAHSSQSANREIEKQSMTQLFGMLMGYYDKITNIAAMFSNPMVPPLAKAAIGKSNTALNELLTKIIKTFEIYDVDSFIVDLAMLEQQMMQSGIQPGGIQAQQALMQQQGGPPNGAGGGNNGSGNGSAQRVLPGQSNMAGAQEMGAGAGDASGGGMSPA